MIPALLGGLDTMMIGKTLYDEFFINRDWPLASAVATVLVLILLVPIMLFQRISQADAGGAAMRRRFVFTVFPLVQMAPVLLLQRTPQTQAGARR